jgi:hypothetical protein
MRKIALILIALQSAVSILFVSPVLVRSSGAFFRSWGTPDAGRKEAVYGPFYRAMTGYLERIPVNENAVIITPPRERAHYFWVLNYYFLPRKIYLLPDSLLADGELARRLGIKHSIFTRSDGFFFDRFPPQPSPDLK